MGDADDPECVGGSNIAGQVMDESRRSVMDDTAASGPQK